MKTLGQEEIRQEVQAHYGAVARGAAMPFAETSPKQATSCCAPIAETSPKQAASCCAVDLSTPMADQIAQALGYNQDELAAAPEGANLGLGCGNPQAIAALREGEVVLDLGSGAGFDSFLAARAVGQKGRVIGVDMTPDMIARAQKNAQAGGFSQVEFREGLIEALPVEDDLVDVVISNCVINLSPDKPSVFREAFRVLRHGGRLAISDVVALQPLPEEMRQAIGLIAGCVGQAAEVQDLEMWLHKAGFVDIRIQPKPESRAFIKEWFPGSGAEEFVASAIIEATKP